MLMIMIMNIMIIIVIIIVIIICEFYYTIYYLLQDPTKCQDCGDQGFKDTVYPFFESALECCFYVVFSCLAILRIEGCLNSAP